MCTPTFLIGPALKPNTPYREKKISLADTAEGPANPVLHCQHLNGLMGNPEPSNRTEKFKGASEQTLQSIIRKR